ncbi:hypothetical protein ACIRRA_45230 [Nocardia sp. NPDC101769]|uniref:nSTAND1 domain-containing NTPase n=1 Tax=Nocardia sp. NPDC101769 TaxID=3364333 RepID=UPI003808E0D5
MGYPHDRPRPHNSFRVRRDRLDRSRLLIVDQLEELFTAYEFDRERMEFLVALESLCAAGQADPTNVVIAIQADFYARCLDYPVVLSTLAEHSYLLGPMSRDELTRAMTRPAGLAGCTPAESLP